MELTYCFICSSSLRIVLGKYCKNQIKVYQKCKMNYEFRNFDFDQASWNNCTKSINSTGKLTHRSTCAIALIENNNENRNLSFDQKC